MFFIVSNAFVSEATFVNALGDYLNHGHANSGFQMVLVGKQSSATPLYTSILPPFYLTLPHVALFHLDLNLTVNGQNRA